MAGRPEPSWLPEELQPEDELAGTDLVFDVPEDREIPEPPPPSQQQEIPKPRSKKVPIPDPSPDPTPDEPEPIRLEEDIEPEIELPDTDLIFGVPDAPPPPEPTGPIRVGGDVKPPRKLRAPDPQYTEIARRARIQGVVIIQAIIDKQGEVTSVKVLKGLPMGLDRAAANAVRRWKFEPATLNGKPVAVIYNLTVNFLLGESPPGKPEPVSPPEAPAPEIAREEPQPVSPPEAPEPEPEIAPEKPETESPPEEPAPEIAREEPQPVSPPEAPEPEPESPPEAPEPEIAPEEPELESPAEEPEPKGLAGIDEIVLSEILVTSPDGPVAHAVDGKGREIVLRKGYELSDGEVLRISRKAVVFRQEIDDPPTTLQTFREVEKHVPPFRPIRFLGRAAYAFNVPTGLGYLEETDVIFRVDPTKTALELEGVVRDMVAQDSRLRGSVEATTGRWSRCMEAELVETTIDSRLRAVEVDRGAAKLDIQSLVKSVDTRGDETWSPSKAGARSPAQRMGLHPTDWRWRIKGIRVGRTQMALRLYAVAVLEASNPGDPQCATHDPGQPASSRRIRTLLHRLTIEVTAAEWVEEELPSPWLWSLLLPIAALVLAVWRLRRGRRR